MDVSTLLAFAAAFFVFAASPGPDNMTIIARTISQGAASGIAYAAGTVVGILIFLTLADFGLSIIAAQMGFVRTLLRPPAVVRRVNRTAGGVMKGAGVAVVAAR